MERCKNILLLLCFMSIFMGYGQNDNPAICRVENGRLIFKLDLRWSDEQKQKISRQFSLDSTVMSNAFSGKLVFNVKGNEWKVRKLNPNIIELSKNLINAQPARKTSDDVILVDDSWITSSTRLNDNPFLMASTGLPGLKFSNMSKGLHGFSFQDIKMLKKFISQDHSITGVPVNCH